MDDIGLDEIFRQGLYQAMTQVIAIAMVLWLVLCLVFRAGYRVTGVGLATMLALVSVQIGWGWVCAWLVAAWAFYKEI
jgi:hypothetical protein